MTEEEMRDRGWGTWYHKDYWVHRESVTDPESQDFTDYGFTFEDAVRYELLGKPKFKSIGSPFRSKVQLNIDTEGLTKVPEPEV